MEKTKTVVVDTETGMTITGYVGQTEEELRKILDRRKYQLSGIPLIRTA